MGEFPLFSGPGASGSSASTTETRAAATVIEQDVEAPDVFAVNEPGLWDGRPSLGGVWVAHPEVADAERVIIRNTGNGQSVVGGLFRREVDNPGPRIQVCVRTGRGAWHARRAADGPRRGRPAPRRGCDRSARAGIRRGRAAGDRWHRSPSLDPLATAAAAIDAAESGDVIQPAPAAAATPAPAAAATSALDKPYIQIGIFSQEDNAENTATSLRNVGIVPTVLAQEIQRQEVLARGGRTIETPPPSAARFWRRSANLASKMPISSQTDR